MVQGPKCFYDQIPSKPSHPETIAMPQEDELHRSTKIRGNVPLKSCNFEAKIHGRAPLVNNLTLQERDASFRSQLQEQLQMPQVSSVGNRDSAQLLGHWVSVVIQQGQTRWCGQPDLLGQTSCGHYNRQKDCTWPTIYIPFLGSDHNQK